MEREAVILPPNLLKCNVWVPTWQTPLATEKMVRLQQGQEMCVLNVDENPLFEKLVSLVLWGE